MHFNEYLKQCRENSRLTQEQLVSDLYGFDIDSFGGLDTTTLSKWERSVIKPKLSRQVKIIQYFQHKTGAALPCWENYSTEEAEEMICKTGMKNLLGKSKKLILDFPSNMIGAGGLSVLQLRNSEMIEDVIDINMELDRSFNHKFSELIPEHFESWALHNSNSFFVCRHKRQFFGLLFTLRVKPDTLDKLMKFEMREKDITEKDFATYDEMGSNYIVSFFAMNDEAASMLFIRYYAHLIAHQKVIEEVGVATMMDDGRKLLEHMNFKQYKSLDIDKGRTIDSYREALPSFLASEQVVKMILSPQSCPEA